MTANWKDLARATLEGSESGTMTFPQSLRLLMEAAFDGYAADFRRSTRTYYMPNGEAIELPTAPTPTPVAESFDASVVREAIREAQQLVLGYIYKGFCAKVAKAGCAGMWSPCSVDECSITAAPARPILSTSLGRSRELGRERAAAMPIGLSSWYVLREESTDADFGPS
jgi:uncharacterized protein YbcV (DUF1398 family)